CSSAAMGIFRLPSRRSKPVQSTLSKSHIMRQLLESINEELQRDAENRQASDGGAGFAERLATLSERERDVLRHVIEGLSSKSIAKQLDISYRTGEQHRSHIMEKLRVRSVAELIRLVIEQRSG